LVFLTHVNHDTRFRACKQRLFYKSQGQRCLGGVTFYFRGTCET